MLRYRRDFISSTYVVLAKLIKRASCYETNLVRLVCGPEGTRDHKLVIFQSPILLATNNGMVCLVEFEMIASRGQKKLSL